MDRREPRRDKVPSRHSLKELVNHFGLGFTRCLVGRPFSRLWERTRRVRPRAEFLIARLVRVNTWIGCVIERASESGRYNGKRDDSLRDSLISRDKPAHTDRAQEKAGRGHGCAVPYHWRRLRRGLTFREKLRAQTLFRWLRPFELSRKNFLLLGSIPRRGGC